VDDDNRWSHLVGAIEHWFVGISLSRWHYPWRFRRMFTWLKNYRRGFSLLRICRGGRHRSIKLWYSRKNRVCATVLLLINTINTIKTTQKWKSRWDKSQNKIRNCRRDVAVHFFRFFVLVRLGIFAHFLTIFACGRTANS